VFRPGPRKKPEFTNGKGDAKNTKRNHRRVAPQEGPWSGKKVLKKKPCSPGIDEKPKSGIASTRKGKRKKTHKGKRRTMRRVKKKRKNVKKKLRLGQPVGYGAQKKRGKKDRSAKARPTGAGQSRPARAVFFETMASADGHHHHAPSPPQNLQERRGGKVKRNFLKKRSSTALLD